MERHMCRQNTLMFALVFCFELRARAARTCCHCHLAVKNPIHDGNQGQLKLPKSHERYHNMVMWHWIVYKWRRSKQRLSFHRTFFNLLVFTVSLSCVLSGTGFLVAHQLLEMWCANAKLATQVPTSLAKTLVIRMSWGYRRCFEWQSWALACF